MTRDSNPDPNRRRWRIPRWLLGAVFILLGISAFSLSHAILVQSITGEMLLAIDVSGAMLLAVGIYLLYHPPERIHFRYGNRPRKTRRKNVD